MTEQARHIDKGQWLRNYARQTIVRCIECDAVSQIYHNYENDCGCRIEYNRFNCPNCQLSLVSNRFHGDWIGYYCLVGNQPCDKCGIRLSTEKMTIASYKQRLPSTSTIVCLHCDRTNEVVLDRYKIDDPSLAIDSDFGLPLFLQMPCRFGKIWAYNQDHLTELQAYVSATLRERTSSAGNSSMISRLPDWIKSAKNRAMISKKLAKLQVELDNYQSNKVAK